MSGDENLSGDDDEGDSKKRKRGGGGGGAFNAENDLSSDLAALLGTARVST